jgi:thiol-disulfide isomerase/thioredoxin
VKLRSQTFVVIVLGLLIHQSVAAQSRTNSQSKKTQPAPRINLHARFRSLNSTTPISLADYQGKVVVLVLWASWCAPCRMVMYGLKDVHQEFVDHGVQVIALSNENPQKADADLRRLVYGFPPDYRVGWISTISADKLMVREDVLPQIFVIRDGVILKTFVGWHPTNTIIELRKALDEAQERTAGE